MNIGRLVTVCFCIAGLACVADYDFFAEFFFGNPATISRTTLDWSIKCVAVPAAICGSLGILIAHLFWYVYTDTDFPLWVKICVCAEMIGLFVVTILFKTTFVTYPIIPALLWFAGCLPLGHVAVPQHVLRPLSGKT